MIGIDFKPIGIFPLCSSNQFLPHSTPIAEALFKQPWVFKGQNLLQLTCWRVCVVLVAMYRSWKMFFRWYGEIDEDKFEANLVQQKNNNEKVLLSLVNMVMQRMKRQIFNRFNNFNPGTFLWWWLVTGVESSIVGFSCVAVKNCDYSRSCPSWWNWKHICSRFKYPFLPCFVQSTWIWYLPLFFSEIVVLLMLIHHMKDSSMIKSIEPWHQGSKGTRFCKSRVEIVGVNGQSSINLACLLQCFNPSVSWQPTITLGHFESAS